MIEIKETKRGFITPVVKETDWKFGSGQIIDEILRPDGQWLDFIPDKEIQNLRGYETANCVAFNSQNQIEITLKRIYDISANYSERDLGIRSGTRPPGNSPDVVYDVIRKQGLAPDELLPFSIDIDTLEKYYSYFGGDKTKIDIETQKWVTLFDFRHDWVAFGKKAEHSIMKEALKYSPLGVAIFAFAFNGEFYVRAGKDGDWVCIVGFREPTSDKKGYWIAYTSYAETNEDIIQQNMKEFNLPREKVLTLKKLDYDFGFYWVKRISIRKKSPEEQLNTIQKNFIIILLTYVANLFKKFYKAGGEFLGAIFSPKQGD